MAKAALIVLSHSYRPNRRNLNRAVNPDDAWRVDFARGAGFALALDLLCTAAMKWQLVMVAALLMCARAHADRRPRPALLSVEAQAGGGVAMGAGTSGRVATQRRHRQCRRRHQRNRRRRRRSVGFVAPPEA